MFDFLTRKPHCPHCGARVRPHATLCPSCGQTLLARKRSEQCPSCGARMTASQAMCPICGAARQTPEGRSHSNTWKVLLGLAMLVVVGGSGLWLKPWNALGDAIAVLVPATSTPVLGASTPIPLPLPSQEATTLAALAVTPSPTPLPPTPTLRPTATATPSPTMTPSPQPSATFTPTITSTPTRAGKRVHTVASGDNLGSIAVQYDVDAASIASANNIKLTTTLRLGQELIVPAPTAGAAPETPTEATPLTTPATAAPTAAVTNTPTTAPTAGPVVHVVQSGDILGSLAVKYGVEAEIIAKANNIRVTTTLRVGQELVIPGAAATLTPTPAPTTTTPEATAAITGTAMITATLAPELTPTSRPTYEFAYLTPPLLAPVDRSVMLGSEANIVLNWASVGILPLNEWYMVTLWPSSRPSDVRKAWVKATSWRVPPDLYPQDGSAIEFTWQVKVVQRFSETEDGVPLSPSSVTYHFTWK